MARHPRTLLALLLAAAASGVAAQEQAPSAAPAVAAGPTGQFLLRANLGIDAIGGGVAFGVGGGYRPLGGNVEYVLDLFRSGYSETYSDAGWNYDYEESLTVLAVRAQSLFGAGASGQGLYTMAGAGFFVAGLSWEERGVLSYDSSFTSDDGDDYTASGTILSLGLGYALTDRLDARLELPIMIFFSERGQGGAVAIPLNVNVAFKL